MRFIRSPEHCFRAADLAAFELLHKLELQRLEILTVRTGGVPDRRRKFRYHPECPAPINTWLEADARLICVHAEVTRVL